MKRIHQVALAALVAGLPGLAFVKLQEPAAAEPGWEEAVAALYASISGPAGQERDWEAFQNQFTEGARMMVSIPTPEGPSRLLVLTPEEYVKRSGAMIVQNGFTEREIGRRAERFGNVVQVFSAYEGRMMRDGKEEVLRGVNCIHLLRGAGGWKIANILWEQESSDNPLPADLLKAPAAGAR